MRKTISDLTANERRDDAQALEIAAADQQVLIRELRFRVSVLESRIRYAIDLLQNHYDAAAVLELDRALNDPDLQKPPTE